MSGFVYKLRSFLFENTSSKQTVLKNTFWLFVAEAVSKGSIAIVIILIGRFFGKEIFGQYSYLSVILTFLLVFADLGITQLTIRDRQHLDDKDRPHRLRTGLSTKFLLSLGVIVLYLGILWFTASSSFLWIVGLMLLFQGIANSFLEYLRATFRSMQRSEIEMQIKFWQGVGNLFLIPLLIITHSLPRILFGQGVITVLTCGYAWWITHKKQILVASSSVISRKELIKNGWMFAMSGLFMSIYYYIDSFIIKIYLPYSDLGVYSSAYRLLLIGMTPISILGNSIYPRLRQEYIAKKKGHKNIMYKYIILLSFFATFITCLLIVLVPAIITYTFGAAYYSGILLTRILLITLIFNTIKLIPAWYLLASGKQHIHLLSTIGASLLNLTLNIIFIPFYGIVAAAITTVITEIFLTIVYIYYFLINNNK